MAKLLVYGTLKRGYGNHKLLESSKFLGVAVTRYRRFFMSSNGSFPYVTQEGKFSIIGELYDIDLATLYACDQLEGHPNFYKREMHECFLETGSRYHAWMYEYQSKIRKKDTSISGNGVHVLVQNLVSYQEWYPDGSKSCLTL